MTGSRAWSEVWANLQRPIPEAQCVLSPVTGSHPVQALLESFTILSGCASKGTATHPQEVHIINLKCVQEDPCQHEKEVTLHLNPISTILVHQKPLVFILNSPHPLAWKLKTERLAAAVSRFFFAHIWTALLQWELLHKDPTPNQLQQIDL
ncbi:hypothetical protein FKM82_001781 [Ascaphus truei]